MGPRRKRVSRLTRRAVVSQHREHEMKQRSRLALGSLVLGSIGLLCVLTRNGGLSVVAFLLGVAAFGTGGVAFWSIHRAPALLRG